MSDPFVRRAGVLALVVASGGAVYLLACLALGVEEMRVVIERIRRLAGGR
jgi:hypothetical protein